MPFGWVRIIAGDWIMSQPSMLSFRNGLVDLALVIDAPQGARRVADASVIRTTIHARRNCNRTRRKWVSVTKLPFDYEPAARCPLWLETLNQIFPSSEEGDRRIEVLQEFFGWCMVPNGLNLEKFLILVGEGANGKSTNTGMFLKHWSGRITVRMCR